MTNYWTIAQSSEGFFKDRGSKFLAFAMPVTTVDEVQQQLMDLRKQYHDARHHCYAYLLGMKEQEMRANDDGEPSHTAGDPILGQIKSFELTNVLVVVIRYFGGTKLGVSGLINAYKTAAALALEAAPKKEIFPAVRFRVHYSYEQTNEVERLLASQPMTIESRVFEAQCTVVARVHEELFPMLEALVEPPSNLSLEVLN